MSSSDNDSDRNSDCLDSVSSDEMDDIVEIRPIELRKKSKDKEKTNDFCADVNTNLSKMKLHVAQKQLFPGQPQERSLQEKAFFVRQNLLPNITPPSSEEVSGSVKFPPVLSLNVGGLKYMTRLSTLTKYPDSMLACMFSGRHVIDKDEYGNYFLDSNGNLFSYILEYLRMGTLPPNHLSLPVYKEANYYGLTELAGKLQFKPDVAMLHVRENHRNQFPNYYEIKKQVITQAMESAVSSRVGEVVLHVFRTEFVPRTPTFNPKHACVTEAANINVGPWECGADEDTFMKCLEADLGEDGFNLKAKEPKKRCKYFMGQACPKCIYKVIIAF